MTEEFFELMKEHNPFAFKNPDGKVCIFKSYVEAYEELLERIYAQAPRGYLDCVLFVMDNCAMSKSYAEEFLKNFENLGAVEKGTHGVCLIQWDDDSKSGDMLCRVARAMHWVLETKFNQSMWLEALNRFRDKHPHLLGDVL